MVTIVSVHIPKGFGGDIQTSLINRMFWRGVKGLEDELDKIVDIAQHFFI